MSEISGVTNEFEANFPAGDDLFLEDINWNDNIE